MADYNGWANYETWNVALWIQNDESLYRMARTVRGEVAPYAALQTAFKDAGILRTPDGVQWSDLRVCTQELDACLKEL